MSLSIEEWRRLIANKDGDCTANLTVALANLPALLDELEQEHKRSRAAILHQLSDLQMIGRLTTTLEQSTNVMEHHGKELDALRMERGALMAGRDAVVAEAEKLQSDLNAARCDLEQQRTRAESVERELSAATMQIVEANVQFRDLAAKLHEELEQQRTRAGTLRATLIGCLRAVKASLSDGVSDSFIADFGVSEVAGCVAHLRDEADQQRTRAEAAEAELRELKRSGHWGGIK